MNKQKAKPITIRAVREDESAGWSSTKKQLLYEPKHPITLMHELGHLILGHKETKSARRFLIQEIEAVKFVHSRGEILDLDELYAAANQAYWIGSLSFSSILREFKDRGIHISRETLRSKLKEGFFFPVGAIEKLEALDYEV